MTKEELRIECARLLQGLGERMLRTDVTEWYITFMQS
jgi:hypothetical protein